MAEELENSEELQEKKKEEKKSKKDKEAEILEDDFESASKGGGFSTVVVTLAIILIWLAVFAILIKMDVGHFGSSIMYPVFKNVPVVKYILPEVQETSEDGDQYGYTTLAEAVEEIKRLQAQVAEYKDASSVDNEVVEELSAEVDRLKKFEQNQVEFESKKQQFYEEVVFNDNAPDVTEYQKYYESIEPETAAELYKQVVEQTTTDEKITEYAKAYGEMKPAQAAKIFEAMTDDLELAASILNNIDATQRGKILGAMDAEVAAMLTKVMEP